VINMRTTDDDFSVWLVGYYDDFQSCRSIADDLNDASKTTPDHTLTHHGNPMNGHALLNPTFRYSYPDRAQSASYLSADDSFSSAQLFATVAKKADSNDGHHEWLTLDLSKSKAKRWEGRAQLQYPDSRRGTRQRFNGAAGDSYEAFVNGNDTLGTYYAPLKAMDSTAGRSRVYESGAKDNDGDMFEGAGAHLRVETEGHFASHSVSLAGVLMGERMNTAYASRASATKHLFPLKSPSGKPFLVSKLYGTGTGKHRILNYDGPMRYQGLGDTFTIRIASHAMGGWTDARYTLNLGYKKADGFNKSTQVFGSNPLLSLDISTSHLNYNSGNYLEIDNYTAADNDSQWTDIDVVLDFSANTYKAYADGSLISSGSFTNNWSASDIYGWSLDVNCAGTMPQNVGMITCIDRASLYISLGDAVEDTDYTPLHQVQINNTSDALSTALVTILDDDNRFSVAPLLSSTGFEEWGVVIFKGNLNRPVWWGTLTGITHTQGSRRNTLDTQFLAEERYGLLDRQLPIWEMGQSTYLSQEGHLALNTKIEKRYNQVKNMGDILNTGASSLKFLNSTIGFVNSDFAEIEKQRTSLNSSHPIQMYINEDVSGPNSAEREWDGFDSPKYMLTDVRYIQNPTGNYQHYIVDSSAYLVGSSGVSASDQVMVTHTNTTGTTNVFTIDSIISKSRSSDAPDETPTSYKAIKVSDSSRRNLTPNALCTQYTWISSDKVNTTKKMLRFTTASAHNLSLGDEILFGSVIDSSSNNEIVSGSFLFDGGRYRVLGVPTTTTFDIEVTNMNITEVASTTNFGNANYRLPILDEDHNDYGVTDNNLHIIGKQQTDYYTSKADRASRNVHTRWMRDISESLWFKSKFGIISKDCYHSAGKSTITNNPVSPNEESNYSPDTSTMVGISTFTTDSTTLTCDDPAIWYWNVVKGKAGILDVINPDTLERDTVLFNGTTAPSNAALTYIQFNGGSFVSIGNKNWRNGFQVSNELIKLWDIVVHTGFDDWRLNGVFQVSGIYSQGSGVTKYAAVRIEGFDSKSKDINDSTSPWFSDPDKLWPILGKKTTTTFDNFTVYEYTNTIGSPTTNNTNYNVSPTVVSYASKTGLVHYGSYTINNVKGQRKDWTQGDFLYRYRKLDESNGYKHLWLLWRDMRNDGNADANGGYNVSDFGLMLPTIENYNLNIAFAEQFDEDGDNTAFITLKIGEELDIWNIDADVEPYSGGDWSDLANASDTYKIADLTGTGSNPYSDWKNKGGSFLIIDASKFFNLNTEASNGRPGYDVGGIAHFSDYDIPIAGTPYLLDNYWKYAVANYQISGTNLAGTTTTNIANHPNQFNFLNDATALAEDGISGNQTTLALEDATHFNLGSGVDGYGVILATKKNEQYLYALRWNGVSGNTLTNVYVQGYGDANTDPVSIRAFLDEDSGLWSDGSQIQILFNDEDSTVDGYDSIVVYNTPAALYGLRLLMNLEGFVEDKNIGTYFESDKLRLLQTIATLDSWTRNSHLNGLADINNVPITKDMTTTQVAHSGTDYEDYGSVSDLRATTFAGGVDIARRNSGSGSGGTTKTFTRVVGRDGRYDYRPAYNTGITLTRNNMKNANLTIESTGIITNVRAYYDGNKSFVDYPTPTTGLEARWKIIDLSRVRSKTEALALAKKEYDMNQTSAFTVNVDLIGSGTETDALFSGGKHGYIADPAVVTLDLTGYKQYACSWTSLFGGIPYPGMCNALDGRFSRADAGTAVVSAVFNDRTTPFAINLTPLGTNQTVGNNGKLKWRTSTNTIDWFKDSLDVSATASHALGDPALSVNQNKVITLTGSGHSITLYVTSLHGISDTQENIEYIRTYNADESYYNYGSRSLSHAMQIVHIPKDVPSVSANWGSELRMGISVASGTSADDAVFTVRAIDYSFANTGSPSQFTPTYKSDSSVSVFGSGFYELAFPSTYGAPAGSKMIISVNAEYLRAILRNRCGDQIKNANNIPGLSTFTGNDARSLYPLGFREYQNEGGISDVDDRLIWYAPRLHIVDDMNYYPSTNLTITDANLDLASQSMVINSIAYSRSHQTEPTLKLSLERNESRFKKTLASLFKDGKPKTGVQDGEGQQMFQPSQPQGQGPTSPNKEGGRRDGGQSINTFSSTTMARLTGKTEFTGDNTSSEAEWGILGQKKIGKSSSANSTIDGFDSIVSGSGSVNCSDGFVLPGVYITSDGADRTGLKHEQTFSVRIPSDALDSYVTIKAKATLDGTKQTTAQNAVMTIKVESKESNYYSTTTKTIASGSTDRKEYTLFSENIKGAIAGSNLKITISRNPGSGSDTAKYRALRIHNVSLATRRATNPSISQAKKFKPY